jgi:serine/threonine protein kinase
MTSLLETGNVFRQIIKQRGDFCKSSFSDEEFTKTDVSISKMSQENNSQRDEYHFETDPLIEKIKNNLNIPEIKGIIDSKYCLIKKIGQGSSAKVYLGASIDSLISDNPAQIEYYSIKIIDPFKMDISMFQKEVELLQNINNQNVLKIFSYGIGKKERIKNNQKKEKDIYYIVMEYLEHDDSLKYITQVCPGENKGFGEEFGRLIFAQLLDGLEAMHNKNIFHRDIKPENIMIGGDDYIFKFVDFGFSTDNIGKLNSYLGTPTYAAPELHLKRPYYGKSEDIFSLGVTLFVLVTGGLPFKMALPNDSLYQHIIKSDYIEYWRKRMVNVSPSFMELFDNLIAYDYSQRPSISEIRESAWMKEINWELMNYLKQELILRENIIIKRKNEQHLIKINDNEPNHNRIQENKFSLLETGRLVRNIDIVNNGNYNYDNINNNNNINLNKNTVVNSAENNNAYEQEGIIVDLSQDKNKNKNLDDYEKKENKVKKDLNYYTENNIELSKGFIRIQIESKNLNIAMTKIKKILKNKGYFSIKRNFNELELEVSNGEIDVLLKIEKFNKDYAKLNYYKVKGGIPQFDLFKKEVHSLKTKVL